MSLKELREKNRLMDSFIHSSSKREPMEFQLSEEDQSFYETLKEAGCRSVARALDELEQASVDRR